ncbi:peptidase m1 membrane alanine aminopeptidase [Nannochloropsis gaditana]|uniref:Peptidase m1 membrane alanine aminopeptidase n=1 Tax=Nannochloropsis gaditana TaxID=72520 RepID=W7TTX3_9STRA|nr:peptidase m1 membrane alanine aminopeptidase [Nannochloropsis gaditana]
MPTYSRHAERGGERGCRHKAVSRLGNHSVNRVKNRMRRKGGKRDSTMDGFLLPGAKSHYVPDLMIFPVHQDIHLDLTQIPQKTLKGVVHITFACRSPTEGRKVVLDAVAFAELAVNSLDARFTLSYRYDGKRVQVVWENPWRVGEQRRIRVLYTVVAPVAGMHFCGDAGDGKGPTYILSDHETEKARYWLPCMDVPAVRTTASFFLTTRPEHLSFANGEWVDSEEGAPGARPAWGQDTRTTCWRLDIPCPSYLLCVAAGALALFKEASEESKALLPGCPIAYIAPVGVEERNVRLAFEPTARMLHWIANKVGNGTFPFPKYYQVMGDAHESAMENISLVSWGLNWLMDETLLKEDRLVMNSINIHEIGHSYFGDCLVIQHFEHAFLKESWATYIECCWLEDTEGQDAFLFQLYTDLRAYITEVEDDYARPIVTRTYNSSWSMYDDHLYPGGSCRLHMLRKLLGDQVFWQAVRAYVDRNMHKVVETSDFRKCLEEVSGRSLVRFFEQWFYTPSFPQLRGEWEYDEETKVITLSIKQGEPEDSDHEEDDDEEICLFDIAFTIEVYNREGVLETTLRPALTRTTRKIVVQAKVSRSPCYLHVNPQLAAVLTLDMECEEEILAATARRATDLPSRIWAYEQLIEEVATPSAMAHVREHLPAEPFWGVRVAVADVLGDNPSRASAQILGELLRAEKDPRALHHIAEACGAFRHPLLRDALLDVWTRQWDLYRAKAEILTSLGSQNDVQDLELLLDICREHESSEGARNDPNLLETNIVGSAHPVGKHNTMNAYEYLKTRLTDGGKREAQLSVRIVVVEAFARAASYVQDKSTREEAAEILAGLLMDEEQRTAETAAWALSEFLPLEAEYYRSELFSLRHRLPVQEHFSLDRLLRDLDDENEEATPLQKLKKKMERWEDRVGAWEEALEEHVADVDKHLLKNEGKGKGKVPSGRSRTPRGDESGSSEDKGSESESQRYWHN